MLKKIVFLCAWISLHSIHSLEMTASHRQGSGVGYNRQYSKVELFHAFESQSLQPFIDLRYLVFNHGKQGANIGIGLGNEFEKKNRVAAYAYFDLRESQTNHFFNQITAGLSYTHPLLVSGKDWGEFTCYFNGYFPMKNREKNIRAPSFASFKGNHLMVYQTDRVALTGTNLELGYLSNTWKEFNLYLAGSAYYFERANLDAFGGFGKLRVTYRDFVSAEVFVSGDRLFGTNVSGTIGVRIPLDKKGMRAVKAREYRLHKLRPVERFEPMVLDTTKRKEVAKDACGGPLNFLFVNNLCGSDGSFEDPFATLLDAQNASKNGDFLYVFEGDGTTRGMDSGIVMQESQTLAGSGTPLRVVTQFGPIVIPQLTGRGPQITNTSGVGVTLAKNTTISGITVNGSTDHGFSYIASEGVSILRLLHCNALNLLGGGVKGYSIETSGESITNVNFVNCQSIRTFFGFAVASAEDATLDTWFENCIARECVNFGFNFANIGNASQKVSAINCKAIENGGEGFGFGTGGFLADTPSLAISCIGCMAHNNQDEGFNIRAASTSQVNFFLQNCISNNSASGDGFSFVETSLANLTGKCIECSAFGNALNSFDVEMLAPPSEIYALPNDATLTTDF